MLQLLNLNELKLYFLDANLVYGEIYDCRQDKVVERLTIHHNDTALGLYMTGVE